MAKQGNLSKHLSIHAASKACGLSPSVLRIWELRYGWPNPCRRPNGYRAYSRHLIDDLKKVAKMVSEGTPISEIIVDGLPAFPQEPETVDAPKRAIEYTRRMPALQNRSAMRMQDSTYSALEQRSGGAILELLQRANWELRPKEELLAVLTPTVIGLLEQQQKDKPMQTSELAIMDAVCKRSQQLLPRFLAQGPEVKVGCAKQNIPALAVVVALALRQRGINAIPRLDTDKVGPEEQIAIRVQPAGKRREFKIFVDDNDLYQLIDETAEFTLRATTAA